MTAIPYVSKPLVSVNQLAAENLWFSYGTFAQRAAVEGASFNAAPGELIAIVGPNGCGKSTLLRLLIGELKPASGHVKLDAIDARELNRLDMARRIALVPQFAAAPFGYTVREMVLMSRHAIHAQSNFLSLGFETSDDWELANLAMWAADVHHLAERPINELSGGERQRVAIARAFTQDTPVMLLDEPTSSLDLFHQLELAEQLRKMTRDQYRLAVVVTHDLNFAATLATRVILMDQGKIIADGPTSRILTPQFLEPVYRVKIDRTPEGLLRFNRLAPP